MCFLLLFTVIVLNRNLFRGVDGIYLVHFSMTFVLCLYFCKSTMFWIGGRFFRSSIKSFFLNNDLDSA